MARRLLLCLLFLPLLAPMAWADSDSERLARVLDMYQGYTEDFPNVQDLAPEELMRLREKVPVVLVDVRPDDERAVSMIPAAISREAFEADPDKFKGKLVVAYCTISYRSGEFAQRMGEKGIPVLNLRGGLLAWLHAGGRVVDADGRPTKRVHVYGEKWDLAPLEYEAVW